ncbi:MAG: RecX family transcriptional regulator [Sedimentibacter saalensis]|uniref:RecX family transcriptional regulator n=1 Tax=Sedimentibacter saalensis TaxID=130788 RepID=UPI002B21B0E9|nr:RecX family transcriptional regulator [Sedimentibacter saalensis]MEA5095559.1 RecX family transcriptional regulator [Sedimentibacter saalensis]
MKKISKIEYQKKNKDRFNIYLDDSYAFAVDMNVMIKYSLAKNMELDDDFISEILTAEEEMNAYNYAVNLLSRAPKSEKELKMKMQDKGYDVIFIENVIKKLREQRYIDDERYSEMFISSKINTSKDGRRKIKEALYNKGINKEIIDEKLSSVSEEEEIERAFLLAKKKLASMKEEDTRKKTLKLSNYLINKGFEYSTVKKVVSSLLKGDFDEFDQCY